MKKLLIAASLCAVSAAAGPALAGNSLIAAGSQAKVAGASISARPDGEWNRLGMKLGKNTEVWTLDGPELNKITFYGGIPVGQPLFKELDKKQKPLPRVSSNMLITDIPAILENSYRSQFNATQMSIDSQEPAIVSGHKGVTFTYSYARQEDEVQRKGEAYGAMVGNKLYLIAYEAPALHFFDKDVGKFRRLAQTLKF